MNKLQLIEIAQENCSLSKGQAKKAVELFFDSMAEALSKGERVEIRGLCSFKVKSYRAYKGRNPKSGDPVIVNSKKLPFFKPGTDLKNRVK